MDLPSVFGTPSLACLPTLEGCSEKTKCDPVPEVALIFSHSITGRNILRRFDGGGSSDKNLSRPGEGPTGFLNTPKHPGNRNGPLLCFLMGVRIVGSDDGGSDCRGFGLGFLNTSSTAQTVL